MLMDPNRPLDRSDLVPMTGGGVSLGMQMDWICMESDPDITCYHILIWTRVQIQIFACFVFIFLFEYLLNSTLCAYC
jgi:hypothetical protein